MGKVGLGGTRVAQGEGWDWWWNSLPHPHISVLGSEPDVRLSSLHLLFCSPLQGFPRREEDERPFLPRRFWQPAGSSSDTPTRTGGQQHRIRHIGLVVPGFMLLHCFPFWLTYHSATLASPSPCKHKFTSQEERLKASPKMIDWTLDPQSSSFLSLMWLFV